MSNSLYKGINLLTNEWKQGSHLKLDNKSYIISKKNDLNNLDKCQIDDNTLCRYTGLSDKDNNILFINDITVLKIDDGYRIFLIEEKTIQREIVCYKGFDATTTKVYITGIVFRWNDTYLFPCIDENLESDVKKMIKIGNKFDDRETLKKIMSQYY